MTESLSNLLGATALFVVSHFVLSSIPVRSLIIGRLAEAGHRILYSIVSFAAFFWMIVAYGDARYEGPLLWSVSPTLSMLPVILLPFSFILIVCSVTSRNPTAVGGERLLHDPNPVQGIMTVTRHPMMVGIALWAATHLLVNGDVASVILFGGILVLSIGGMIHIDHRRRILAGSSWGPMALSTSIVPFLAVVQGRTRIDWAGIGLVRVVIGLAVYAGFVFAHPWIAGVSITG